MAASSMALRLVFPVACSSLMIGARSEPSRQHVHVRDSSRHDDSSIIPRSGAASPIALGIHFVALNALGASRPALAVGDRRCVWATAHSLSNASRRNRALTQSRRTFRVERLLVSTPSVRRRIP
jgi:hypothetical protein